MNMNHPSDVPRRVNSMPFRTKIRPTRNGVTQRGYLGFVGLMAVLAMVFAGPSHLWLVHGGSHDHEVHEHGVESAVLTSCHGHHHACGGHGHADLEGPLGPEEDENDSSPCSSTDDCDACIAIGATKPIELVENIDLGVFRFVQIEHPSDHSTWYSRESGPGVPRGPPSIA